MSPPDLCTVPGRIAHRKIVPLPKRGIQHFKKVKEAPKLEQTEPEVQPEVEPEALSDEEVEDKDVDELIKQMQSWKLREEIISDKGDVNNNNNNVAMDNKGDENNNEPVKFKPPPPPKPTKVVITPLKPLPPVATKVADEVQMLDELKIVSASPFMDGLKVAVEGQKVEKISNQSVKRTAFVPKEKVSAPESPKDNQSVDGLLPAPKSLMSIPRKKFFPRAAFQDSSSSSDNQQRCRLPPMPGLVTSQSSRLWREPNILVVSDPIVRLYLERSIQQQEACFQNVYVYRRPIQGMPHDNELRSIHEPERLLNHLLKTAFGLNLKTVKDLYYFAGSSAVLALRLRNVTIYQAHNGTDIQRMYRLCNMATEDIMTGISEDLLTRFHWRALSLSTSFEEAMAYIKFVVVEMGPGEYYAQLWEEKSGAKYAGFGRSLVEAKGHAVYSFVNAF